MWNFKFLFLRAYRVIVYNAPCRSKACHAGNKVTPTKSFYWATGPPIHSASIRRCFLFIFISFIFLLTLLY